MKRLTKGLRRKRRSFSRGKTRWLRPDEMPFSRGYTYKLIDDGVLFSVELKLPGSGRSVRLIDANSLDRYLLKLGREQREVAP
jgi:hypothetical protein